MVRSTLTGEPGERSRGERGFLLVFLVGLMAVMGIAVAAAIPHWVAIQQRERENELIARGFQYAEAIRVFQKRFGRLPNRLQELVEVEPRAIRQLWKDPMPDGGWLVLMQVPGGGIVPIDPKTGEVVAPPPVTGGDENDTPPTGRTGVRPIPGGAPGLGGGASPGSVAGGPSGGPGVSGPIHGVKSRAHGEAYHKLFGETDYGAWEFTVERLVAATSAKTPDGLPRRMNYATMGKPFRYPPPGGIPGTSVQPGQRGAPQPPGNPPGSPSGNPPGSAGQPTSNPSGR